MDKIKINPLNVFDIRRVDFCPPYWESMIIPQKYNIQKALEEWVHTNLKGRYYINKEVVYEEEQPLSSKVKIAFEESKELSYFALACPLLKYRN